MTAGRDPDVLTVAEAAERLRISERHCRTLIERGVIPSLRWGRLIRVPVAQFEALLHGSAAPTRQTP